MGPLNRFRSSVVVALMVAGSVLAVEAPAHAADGVFSGTAAATQVDVLNGAVVSGPTSFSALSASAAGQSTKNRLVEVDVAGLLHASTLSTDVSTSAADGGTQITSTAQAAGVRLLGGAITLDAVTTSSTVSLVGDRATYGGKTELLGLTVGGTKIPVTVAPNTRVNLPGLADVVINKVAGTRTSDASARVEAVGLEVTLLKPVANAPAGAVIRVTPTAAAVAQPAPSEGPVLGGTAYVVKASARVLGLTQVLAGPVAAQYMPPGGTAGQDADNPTLGVNLPPLVRAGVASATANGTRRSTGSNGTMSAQVANLNLLNGQIVAELVKSSATVARASNTSSAVRSGASTLVGLKIAGKSIPVQVPPNTTIAIPGVGTVTLNEQIPTSNGIKVRALHIVVTTAGLGYPLGAEIDVSAAEVFAGLA